MKTETTILASALKEQAIDIESNDKWAHLIMKLASDRLIEQHEKILELEELINYVPSVDKAYEIGATGGEPIEAERLAFEAWMKGHCWEVSKNWNGRTYDDDKEYFNRFDPIAIQSRQLWAAWRDRAALSRHWASSAKGGE